MVLLRNRKKHPLCAFPHHVCSSWKLLTLLPSRMLTMLGPPSLFHYFLSEQWVLSRKYFTYLGGYAFAFFVPQPSLLNLHPHNLMSFVLRITSWNSWDFTPFTFIIVILFPNIVSEAFKINWEQKVVIDIEEQRL